MFLIIILTSLLLRVQGDSRLVGGSKVPPGNGLFHASLQNVTGHHVCGGAIITHKHAVTAAHCVLGADPKNIKLVVGTTNLDVGGSVNEVKSIHIHPDYNTTARIHDIAVIEVKQMLDLNYADMIRLDKKPLREGDIVVLTGFGAKKKNGDSSRKMYYLEAPVFNQDTCKYAMRYSKRNVVDSMFCTFTSIGEGTCHGDSGGPLTRNNKLVGLVSWGIPCAIGYPDVHTRIDVYIDWINDVIDKTIPKCIC
ncbi:chymotrypsin-2-like [Pieris brassicae]|uniref:Peptidase S1 domain-containing protein n=1 Tax=Pieris brassicae TaxID=7116 RepID=A0A9P0SZA1_PIEBR|nr:chymotrypsin-2-like [Pieris brassicae]CAH3984275.1 unnamed protein product [Pieris brassicae]